MLSWLVPTDIAEEEGRRTAEAADTRCSLAVVAGTLLAGCDSLDLGSKTSQEVSAMSGRKGAAYAGQATMRRMLIVAWSGKRVL
jgi:hypothetical protein